MSEKHNFNVKKIAGKPFCANCGLVLLRNLLTDWCVKHGCDYSEQPGYRKAIETLPARHRGEA